MGNDHWRISAFDWTTETLLALRKSLNKKSADYSDSELRKILDDSVKAQGLDELLDILESQIDMLSKLNDQKWKIMSAMAQGDPASIIRELDASIDELQKDFLDRVANEIEREDSSFSSKDIARHVRDLKDMQIDGFTKTAQGSTKKRGH